MRILIQPTLATFDEYQKYANENNFDFEIVDFASSDVLDSSPEELVKQYLAKEDSSRLISMHGAFIDLYINSPDSTIKKAAQNRIIQNLEIAKELGLKYVIFHTNNLPMMGREAYYEGWVKEHVSFWKEIIARYDVTILLENMWDKTPEYVARVIEEVNSPQLKLCFDTGHFNVFSEVPIEEWFKRLGSNIAYLHLNDNKGDRDSELTLGEGTIDWKKVSDLVLEHCNKPLVVIELKNLQMIESSVLYSKKNKLYPYN